MDAGTPGEPAAGPWPRVRRAIREIQIGARRRDPRHGSFAATRGCRSQTGVALGTPRTPPFRPVPAAAREAGAAVSWDQSGLPCGAGLDCEGSVWPGGPFSMSSRAIIGTGRFGPVTAGLNLRHPKADAKGPLVPPPPRLDPLPSPDAAARRGSPHPWILPTRWPRSGHRAPAPCRSLATSPPLVGGIPHAPVSTKGAMEAMAPGVDVLSTADQRPRTVASPRTQDRASGSWFRVPATMRRP